LPNTLKTKKIIFTAEQIGKRVAELGKQISTDYKGKQLVVVGIMDNGFMFTSDLVRQIEYPIICTLVAPAAKDKEHGTSSTLEIFYSPEVDCNGKDVLVLEAITQSGVTTEFLMRNFSIRGAASVKLCTLLDKQSERRVLLQPDYFGFLLDESYVVGYGLGSGNRGRNLPHIASVQQ
jgi:hypoxanthine phosphoribosyltransferase